MISEKLSSEWLVRLVKGVDEYKKSFFRYKLKGKKTPTRVLCGLRGDKNLIILATYETNICRCRFCTEKYNETWNHYIKYTIKKIVVIHMYYKLIYMYLNNGT